VSQLKTKLIATTSVVSGCTSLRHSLIRDHSTITIFSADMVVSCVTSNCLSAWRFHHLKMLLLKFVLNNEKCVLFNVSLKTVFLLTLFKSYIIAGSIIEWWGAGMVVSGVRCRLAYGPADATVTHCLLLQ